MSAPLTTHIGDESRPVKAIVIVHHDAPTVVEADAPAAWITIAATAKQIGMSRGFVADLITGDKLVTRKVGVNVQVCVESIARYEASLPTAKKDTTGTEGARRNARQHMQLVGAKR